VVELLCARWTAQRAVHAVRCTIAHTRIARCLDSLSASDTGRRTVGAARLHHPAVVIDEHLDTALGADPLRDVLDQTLPIVGVASREKDTAADKRYMCDATCKFHHLASLLHLLKTGEQALGHAGGEMIRGPVVESAVPAGARCPSWRGIGSRWIEGCAAEQQALDAQLGSTMKT